MQRWKSNTASELLSGPQMCVAWNTYLSRVTETAVKDSEHLNRYFEPWRSRLVSQTAPKPTAAPFIPAV